jgi:hypothetical protein
MEGKRGAIEAVDFLTGDPENEINKSYDWPPLIDVAALAKLQSQVATTGLALADREAFTDRAGTYRELLRAQREGTEAIRNVIGDSGADEGPNFEAYTEVREQLTDHLAMLNDELELINRLEQQETAFRRTAESGTTPTASPTPSPTPTPSGPVAAFHDG